MGWMDIFRRRKKEVEEEKEPLQLPEGRGPDWTYYEEPAEEEVTGEFKPVEEPAERGRDEEEVRRLKKRLAEEERLTEAERQRLRIEKERAKVALAEQRAELRKLKETSWERTKRGGEIASKVSGAIYKVATLGGPIVKTAEERRKLYFGKAAKGLYGISGTDWEKLHTPKAQKRLYAPDLGEVREVTTPRLGLLGRTTRLENVSIKGSAVKSGEMNAALARLRRAVLSGGSSWIEHAALEEIKANNDRDTIRHVVSELSKLGISRQQAEEAIKSLLQRKLVRKTRDFRGEEPVLEIV